MPQSKKEKLIHARSKEPRFQVEVKNVTTKGKWERKPTIYNSLPQADAQAEFIKNDRIIQSKNKPRIKTQTRIVRIP